MATKQDEVFHEKGEPIIAEIGTVCIGLNFCFIKYNNLFPFQIWKAPPF